MTRTATPAKARCPACDSIEPVPGCDNCGEPDLTPAELHDARVRGAAGIAADLTVWRRAAGLDADTPF